MENLEEEKGLEQLENAEVNNTPPETKYTLDQYHGVIVTPENRRALIETYGKEAVLIAQKAYKGWLKGKTHFTYKGERYPIMTAQHVFNMEENRKFFERLQQLQEIQESENQNEEE